MPRCPYFSAYLTGRVVDQANVISPATKDQLTEILTNIENTTTDQIVIVTLPTLDGNSIEDYGYKLARHWGIGQKDKDNGAIIIVDVNERSIRIEVGYGLEAKLTDAVTSEIIRNQIAPCKR
ncbi:TPM domain-containing protein [Candidatus Aquarickettsia rohweri]|uniref:TPM domain-containing protein n=1 Tax=Candidatus Aquarickettsia rohweri TaxID=2602574 RepID=UPI00196B5E42|nr:TPM domain-containing protein [Candidatus Aquarickettsia rohweri]